MRQDLAAETGAAADVEDHRWRGEREEREGAVGHCRLDLLDTRGGCVFARFGVIVEEVGRPVDV